MADTIAGKDFSRRDFLKVVGVGLGGAVLAKAGVELATNPRFNNAIKVTRELIEAKISNDPERIIESRKLAMVWLFAETSAKYGKEMGLEGASLGIDNYLYGNGKPVDISPMLEKVVKAIPEMFVGELISSAVHDAMGRNYSPKKDYRFTRMALKQLTSADGLKTALDARQMLGWQELYYAFGGAKYVLHAPEASITSQDMYAEHVVLESGVEITASDRYYWRLGFEMGLDSKASWFAKDVAGKMFDQFYKSHEFVDKTIRSLGLSDDQINRIMGIYSDDSRIQVEEDLGSGSYELVRKVNESLIGAPDLVEADLNLLKKLGAMEYDMTGHIIIPNRLEIVV